METIRIIKYSAVNFVGRYQRRNQDWPDTWKQFILMKKFSQIVCCSVINVQSFVKMHQVWQDIKSCIFNALYLLYIENKCLRESNLCPFLVTHHFLPSVLPCTPWSWPPWLLRLLWWIQARCIFQWLPGCPWRARGSRPAAGSPPRSCGCRAGRARPGNTWESVS